MRRVITGIEWFLKVVSNGKQSRVHWKTMSLVQFNIIILMNMTWIEFSIMRITSGDPYQKAHAHTHLMLHHCTICKNVRAFTPAPMFWLFLPLCLSTHWCASTSYVNLCFSLWGCHACPLFPPGLNPGIRGLVFEKQGDKAGLSWLWPFLQNAPLLLALNNSLTETSTPADKTLFNSNDFFISSSSIFYGALVTDVA